MGFFRKDNQGLRRATRIEEPSVQTETAFGVIGWANICISLDSEAFRDNRLSDGIPVRAKDFSQS
jgi:hypothetical protein